MDPVHTTLSLTATHESIDSGCPGKRSLMSPHSPHENRFKIPSPVPHTTLRPPCKKKKTTKKKNRGNWSSQYRVVSIRVAFIRPRAPRLHKNFDHFKYRLRVNKKIIYLGWMIPRTWNYLHLDWINLYRNETTGKPNSKVHSYSHCKDVSC